MIFSNFRPSLTQVNNLEKKKIKENQESQEKSSEKELGRWLIMEIPLVIIE